MNYWRWPPQSGARSHRDDSAGPCLIPRVQSPTPPCAAGPAREEPPYSASGERPQPKRPTPLSSSCPCLPRPRAPGDAMGPRPATGPTHSATAPRHSPSRYGDTRPNRRGRRSARGAPPARDRNRLGRLVGRQGVYVDAVLAQRRRVALVGALIIKSPTLSFH